MGSKKRQTKRRSTIASGYSPNFLLVAIGYAFVALDIAVNGYELLLPDFIGFILIAIGCNPDRRDSFICRSAVGLAAVLAVVTLPDLIRFAYRESFRSFDSWVFYPHLILELLLMLAVTLLIWREAASRKVRVLQGLAVATVPILLLTLSAWSVAPRESNSQRMVATYQIPAVWLIGVSLLAHRKISPARPH